MEDFRAFQAEVTRWANETFPGSTLDAKLAHLRQEIDEIEAEPGDGSEYADCLLILLHAAGANGIDLFAEAQKKHQVNLSRTWGKPDAQGVVRHT